jgi:hypothetical protein
MPDPILILQSMAAAAVTAAVVTLLARWPRQTFGPARGSAACVLGLGVGVIVGCWWLGIRPHWPPREDQDRLVLILLPAIVVVEFAAAFLGRTPYLAWLLRLIIAAIAASVLLHQSVYITDLAGPGSRLWTPAQTWLVLAGLAGALAAVWTPLALQARRTPTWSVPFGVALTCAGAGVTLMLSGYASAGQIGFEVLAAMFGAMLASLALPGRIAAESVLGVGVVLLYALLIMGRFFGELSTLNSALLFAAPLLGWLPELPYVRRIGPWFRGVLRLGFTVAAIAVVVALAQKKFAEESTRNSPGSREPSIEDYMNFGK